MANVELWQNGLCGCFDDCGSCCLGIWCPCILYGQNKSATTGEGCIGGCCTFFCLQVFAGFLIPCVAAGNRSTIRQIYGLPAQPCDDCCTYCFCGACALCQESRELKSRGANSVTPAVKSKANQPQQQVVVVQTAAPIQQGAPATGAPAGVFKV